MKNTLSLALLLTLGATSYTTQPSVAAPSAKVTPCELERIMPTKTKKVELVSERYLRGDKRFFRVFTNKISEGNTKIYEYLVQDNEKLVATAVITPTYKLVGQKKTTFTIKTCGQAGDGVLEAPTIKTSISNQTITMYGLGNYQFTRKGIVFLSTKFGIYKFDGRKV